jgi:wobble nucleotide-excising tRNase
VSVRILGEVKDSERCPLCKKKLCTNEDCEQILSALSNLFDALYEAFKPMLDEITKVAELIVEAVEHVKTDTERRN